MTTTTTTLWSRIVAGARRAWREPEKPNAFDEQFIPSERPGKSIMGPLIELAFMAVLLASIAYIAADIFLRFGSPAVWLIYQIAWLYSLLCRQGACVLPYLNAGLVVGVDLVVLFTISIWRFVETFGQPDDFRELHDHLNLISEQLRVDYDGLGKLEERMNAMEVSIEAADSRVDMVVEYQPKSQSETPAETVEARPGPDGDPDADRPFPEWLDRIRSEKSDLTSEAVDDAEPTAPAA